MFNNNNNNNNNRFSSAEIQRNRMTSNLPGHIIHDLVTIEVIHQPQHGIEKTTARSVLSLMGSYRVPKC